MHIISISPRPLDCRNRVKAATEPHACRHCHPLHPAAEAAAAAKDDDDESVEENRKSWEKLPSR